MSEVSLVKDSMVEDSLVKDSLVEDSLVEEETEEEEPEAVVLSVSPSLSVVVESESVMVEVYGMVEDSSVMQPDRHKSIV